jgi:predicted DNA-binding transcriptional regulator YafY
MRNPQRKEGAAMRYEKADNLLQLALEMQAARGGLSLADIETLCGVGRRTAMRMRDALLRNFPQVEEVETGDRSKRWRLPAGTLDRLVSFTAEEMAVLETAARLLSRDNRENDAEVLTGVSAKLRALMKPDLVRRVEPDMEVLLESEGLAARPGPRSRIDTGVVDELRQAMMASRKVRIQYRSRHDRKIGDRVVHPYGFLHGHRNYLVAWHESPKGNRVALFALPNIQQVEMLPESFIRDPDFSLEEFAARSFGVFQGEAYDVVWKFAPEAAEDAGDFIFHPSQQTVRQDDGSLIVRFRAAGDLEMAWHLYIWGDKVEVLEPQHLAEMVSGRRAPWPALP